MLAVQYLNSSECTYGNSLLISAYLRLSRWHPKYTYFFDPKNDEKATARWILGSFPLSLFDPSCPCWRGQRSESESDNSKKIFFFHFSFLSLFQFWFVVEFVRILSVWALDSELIFAAKLVNVTSYSCRVICSLEWYMKNLLVLLLVRPHFIKIFISRV